MTVSVVVVFCAAALVFAIAVVLIFHPDYHDGLARRIALAFLGFAAWIRLLEILQSGWEEATFAKVALLVWIGIAIFLADHFYNFLKHLYRSRERKSRKDDLPKRNDGVRT